MNLGHIFLQALAAKRRQPSTRGDKERNKNKLGGARQQKHSFSGCMEARHFTR
jgi:hypothetical protein